MNQVELAEVLLSVDEAEPAAETFHVDVADDQVGLCACAVGDDRALDVRDDGLHVWLVKTEDCRAIKRNAIDELDERALNVFERRVLIEVLAVDGGDHGDDGRVVEEAAVTFVCFDDEVFALPKPGGGSGLIDFSADDKSRVEMRSGENRSNHGGCGGFAVRPGDGDAVLEAHQLGKHFRPRNNGYFAFMRLDDFGIFVLDCRRDDDDVRVKDVRSLVSFEDGGTEVLQSL